MKMNIIQWPLNHLKTVSGCLKEPIEFRSPSPMFGEGWYWNLEIENKKLFLVSLQAFILDSREVGIEYVFPGEPVVFANWFTGKLRVPIGDYLHYTHSGRNLRFDLILKIEKKGTWWVKDLTIITEKQIVRRKTDAEWMEKL